jgi:hypothetical protein
MAFLIFNPMKFLNILLIILPMFFSSCSCERDAGDAPNTPAWVSKQFYLAVADEAYYDAMEYCDKSTKRKLESDYSFLFNMPKITFVKVDSCDEFEDHAYCYCRYKKEDSTENIHKLLVRNFDQLWKVHYDLDTMGQGESRLYSDHLEELGRYAQTSSELTSQIVGDLDSILQESSRIMNNNEFVVGFFSSSDIHKVCRQASKKSTHDAFYIKRTFLDEIEASTTFHFEGEGPLTEFDVVLLDVDLFQVSGVYQYMIEGLIKEYGTPYNAKDMPIEFLYRYKEIKWFLQGFNEELIISNEYQNITITLKEAY